MRLLSPDLEHIADNLAVGFAHFPIFEEAGIRQVINGPFTFSPDGNPLLGPVTGLPGYWSACAVMAGLSQGGGVGLALANWMTEGDPGFDIWGMDISRYGDFATMAYTTPRSGRTMGAVFASLTRMSSWRAHVHCRPPPFTIASPTRTQSGGTPSGSNQPSGSQQMEMSLWRSSLGTARTRGSRSDLRPKQSAPA
jgi:hypothetical protein